MTPEETKSAAVIMMAAEYDPNGKCQNIQAVLRGEEKEWFDNARPKWDWESCDYRVKPKPELKKGQIIEVKDDLNGPGWFLRRFSQWATGGKVFAYDGSHREQHDCIWRYWRLPE